MMARRFVVWVTLVLTGLLVWASFATTNAVAIGPGQVVDVARMVRIGQRRLPRGLELDAASVSVSTLSPLAWLLDHVAGNIEILQGLHTSTVISEVESSSTESAVAAAVAGYRSLGIRVPATRGLLIRAVVPGSPADGHLQTGDLVLAADGQPTTTLADLDTALASHPTNARISLEVVTANATAPRRILLPVDGGRLGVVLTPATLYRLPDRIAVDLPHALEGSAGLAEATTILLMLSRSSLPRHLAIGLVGLVAPTGRVLPVFGLAARVLALSGDHLRYVLVPAAQVSAARAVVGDRSIVIGVRTLADVLAFVRRVHTGGAPSIVAH